MDPDFGNISIHRDTDTHIGGVTATLFHTMETFLLKTVIKSDEGKVILNGTFRPCDKDIVKRINRLSSITGVFRPLQNSGSGHFELKCPIEVIIICNEKFLENFSLFS